MNQNGYHPQGMQGYVPHNNNMFQQNNINNQGYPQAQAGTSQNGYDSYRQQPVQNYSIPAYQTPQNVSAAQNPYMQPAGQGYPPAQPQAGYGYGYPQAAQGEIVEVEEPEPLRLPPQRPTAVARAADLVEHERACARELSGDVLRPLKERDLPAEAGAPQNDARGVLREHLPDQAAIMDGAQQGRRVETVEDVRAQIGPELRPKAAKARFAPDRQQLLQFFPHVRSLHTASIASAMRSLARPSP